MKFLQQQFLWLVVVSFFTSFSSTAQAFDLSKFFEAPVADLNLECKGAQGKPLNVMNEIVLGWKTSTRDQYQSRALVKGLISQFYPDRNGHTHFGIHLDSNGTGDLEVIYNDNFGELPKLNVGMQVVACGDYITVGPHARLPSPLGAIIHWVHYNPGDRDGGKHPHGFLVINNQPYGIAASARNRSH